MKKELISCPKCKGDGKDSVGGRCKKCQGFGFVTVSDANSSMIYDETKDQETQCQ